MILREIVPQARKRFGQHWLRSDKVLDAILQAAALQPSDRILEIGPGTGILTRALLPQVQAVVAVEIDRDLCQLLAEKFGRLANFLLLQGDILTLDLAALLEPYPAFRCPNKVVANIPYNITGPILEKFLGRIAQPPAIPLESLVLLLQKEVAQRLVAQPGQKAYGALSVRVQYLAKCEWICDVPARAFSPPPQVDSAVVRLCPRPYPHPPADPQRLETLIKLGFAERRKMLRNNLKSVTDRHQLTPILEQLEINPQARAEDLSLDQWIALANASF